jgi:hypothetical protein
MHGEKIKKKDLKVYTICPKQCAYHKHKHSKRCISLQISNTKSFIIHCSSVSEQISKRLCMIPNCIVSDYMCFIMR